MSLVNAESNRDDSGDEPGEETWSDAAHEAADQPFYVKARRRAHFANLHESVDGRSVRPKKPSSPLKLTRSTWKYSIKRAAAEFSNGGGTDMAAALTYYAVLSLFPALIAGVSLLSLIGEADSTRDAVLDFVAPFLNATFMETIEPFITAVTSAPGAGIGLVIGILTAMWTASNFVTAFSRALNRMYEVEEGRGFIQLRPLLYAVTAGLIVMVTAAALMLVISGPVAESLGNVIGMGSTAVALWEWLTPVFLLVVAMTAVGLLYYFTPNIQQPSALWMTPGALLAIVVMVISTIAVGIYIGNFANYDATYGALAGVIILLFWVYIMNIVLLFGAQLDVEVERGRQLQAGIFAERTLMLAPRSTVGSDKKHQKYENLVREGEILRLSAGETTDPETFWRR